MSDEFDKWFDSLGEYARDEEGEFYSAMKKAWIARGELESTKEIRFGCFADPKLEIIYPDCLLDSESDQLPRQVDCIYNKKRKLKKTDCPYWRPIND